MFSERDFSANFFKSLGEAIFLNYGPDSKKKGRSVGRQNKIIWFLGSVFF